MKKTKIKLSAAAVLIILLCCVFNIVSCASAAKNRDALYTFITDTSRFFLLPTADIEETIDMPQRISASFQDMEFYMLAWVKADTSSIEMVMLNELGAGIGELIFTDQTISFSSIVFPESIRPEYIVADFQLCFYNVDSVQMALKNCGLYMETTGTTRRIFQGKNLIYEITGNSGSISLVNHLRGYTYTLEGEFN